MACASSLANNDKVYAEVFNTASKHPRVKLFNFTYSLKRQNKNDSLYRCERSDDNKCNASITILDCDHQVVKVCGLKVSKIISADDILATHNHSSSEIHILKKEFEFNLMTRSASDTMALPKIYQQEESKIYRITSQKGISDEEIALNLKTFQSKKSAMYSKKSEKYPPNPKCLEDIVIEGEFTKCENGVDLFLIKDIKDIDPNTKKTMRIIIFGSSTMLKVLCDEATSLHTSDGTFAFAADLFFQVYIIMAYFHRRMFPCVYTLLNGKTKEAYLRMLNEIRLAYFICVLQICNICKAYFTKRGLTKHVNSQHGKQ